MRKSYIAAITAGLLTLTAMAQTSANGSASGNASVTPGQASAGANASQSTQTTGASTNLDGSANAKASQPAEKKPQGKDSAPAGSPGAGLAGASGASGALSSGTTLQAELTKSLDAKKAKPGDEVTAKVTQDVKSNGNVVIHKGSRLVGHVTEAQAKSKDNAESKLGVVFDKAVLKGGQEVAFNGMIQALAPPAQGALSVAGDEGSNLGSGMGSGNSMGGGHSGGVGGGLAPIGAATSAAGSTVNSAAGVAGNATGSVTGSTGAVSGVANRTTGLAANGALTSGAHGVLGMQGVALDGAAAGSAQGSVISSASKNIKLDSGTQMILQVAGSAAAH